MSVREAAMLAGGETESEMQEQALLRKDFPQAYEAMLRCMWQRQNERENEMEEMMRCNGL
jgi:hypothetical protein